MLNQSSMKCYWVKDSAGVATRSATVNHQQIHIPKGNFIIACGMSGLHTNKSYLIDAIFQF